MEIIATVKEIDEEAEELIKITQQESLNISVIKMDVTNESEVKEVFSLVKERFGRIDTLVNNAGFGMKGPVEDFSIDEVKEVFDVNYFGAIRTIKEALPIMREQGFGHIINISSVNGLLSFGLYGIYSSTKFALETMSEALQFEVQPFNIKVSIVEPGAFNTSFSKNSRKPKAYDSGHSPYKNLTDPLDRGKTSILEKNKFISKIINPEIVAEKIYKIANTSKPRLRYKVGIDTKLYTFIHSLTPYGLWQWALRKFYKW